MRVAICQDTIVSGGRLRVILGFVHALNTMGVEPDVITAKFKGRWDQIKEKYGLEVKANLVEVGRFTRPQDLATLYFNSQLRKYAQAYDLLINTTNSLAFLPKSKPVLSYIFLPRKFWISTKVWNNHLPDKPIPSLSKRWLYRKLLQFLYKMSEPQPHHQLVAMTHYAKEMLLSAHPGLTSETIPVIYPPVDVEKFYSTADSRSEQIVTIGRFSPDKRQLEQIRIAEQLPHIPFHIVGFVSSESYLRECQRYIESNQLSHVYLHPNAPFSEMVKRLQSSRYFLHALVNEEFGITAVQAIAAGCVPIVHDSGGQRETVPESSLRYGKLGEVLQILSNLDRMEPHARQELVTRLQGHVMANFSEEVFKENVTSVLKTYQT